ncbi:MAG: paraquat-inducible protein A [Opitutaceae bacterium]|jgi:paraquat-inducible protein A
MGPSSSLSCHLCGQEHRAIHLESGEKALCVRCDTIIAQRSRLGPDAALVFSITGLILAPPAALLTFVSAGKLGAERISLLFTGVGSLWDGGMRSLAVLVFLCGGLIPLALLATLAAVYSPLRLVLPGTGFQFLVRAARLIEHWAIPEVQVLAVLVALMKLGSVVDVTIGPGFWCYCAMALSLLIAQHSFDFDSIAGSARAADSESANMR